MRHRQVMIAQILCRTGFFIRSIERLQKRSDPGVSTHGIADWSKRRVKQRSSVKKKEGPTPPGFDASPVMTRRQTDNARNFAKHP